MLNKTTINYLRDFATNIYGSVWRVFLNQYINVAHLYFVDCITIRLYNFLLLIKRLLEKISFCSNSFQKNQVNFAYDTTQGVFDFKLQPFTSIQ